MRLDARYRRQQKGTYRKVDNMTTFIWLMLLVIVIGAGYYWFQSRHREDEEGRRIYACIGIGAACAFAHGLILQSWFPLGGIQTEIAETIITAAEVLLQAWILFLRRRDFSKKQKIVVVLTAAFLISILGTNIRTIVQEYRSIWADTDGSAQILNDIGQTVKSMAEEKLTLEKYLNHDVEIAGSNVTFGLEKSHQTVKNIDYTVAFSYCLDREDTERIYGYKIRVSHPGSQQQELEVLEEGEGIGEAVLSLTTEE